MHRLNPPLLAALGLSLLFGAAQAQQTCNDQVTPTTPDSRFQDNGDGTVLDLETHLIWKKCAEGADGYQDCDRGSPATFTWQEALDRPGADYGCSRAWRLPNKDELASLVERQCTNPAINEGLFPKTPPSWFWSSTWPNPAEDPWALDFGNGSSNTSDQNNSFYVRLVRSDTNTRFRDNGDGTVTDLEQHLIWKKCAEGLSGNDCAEGGPVTFNWDDAQAYAQAVDFGGSRDWRVPTKDELASLLETDCHRPSINRSAFPNTPSDWFWSSSPSAGYSSLAWYVHFSYGAVGDGGKNFSLSVRLVRAGQ